MVSSFGEILSTVESKQIVDSFNKYFPESKTGIDQKWVENLKSLCQQCRQCQHKETAEYEIFISQFYYSRAKVSLQKIDGKDPSFRNRRHSSEKFNILDYSWENLLSFNVNDYGTEKILAIIIDNKMNK